MITTNETNQRSARDGEQAGIASLAIDYAAYEEYLANSDLSDEQKQEFLDCLWSIIVSFVDLGFGVHPLQQADEACGQELDLTSLMASDVVNSKKGLPKQEFSKAASRDPTDCAEKENV